MARFTCHATASLILIPRPPAWPVLHATWWSKYRVRVTVLNFLQKARFSGTDEKAPSGPRSLSTRRAVAPRVARWPDCISRPHRGSPAYCLEGSHRPRIPQLHPMPARPDNLFICPGSGGLVIAVTNLTRWRADRWRPWEHGGTTLPADYDRSNNYGSAIPDPLLDQPVSSRWYAIPAPIPRTASPCLDQWLRRAACGSQPACR